MYKISKYNIATKIKDNYILYNCLTNATVRLNKDNFETFANGKVFENLDSDLFRFLYNNLFIIDNSFNEEEAIQQIENVLNSDEYLNVIFMTTNNCNFNCVYCYENHENIKIETDVYASVYKYIQKFSPKNLMITWYGGEPTLEAKSIINFMQEVKSFCQAKSINLMSHMTTNGYLLTSEMMNDFCKLGINDYQITVDGLEKEHDGKRYLKNKGGTHKTIIENLKNIKNTALDFKICIRYNYDDKSDINSFLDFFSDNFSEDKRFYLNIFPVCNWSTIDCADDADASIAKGVNLVEHCKYALKKGIQLVSLEHASVFSDICYASMKNSLVVNANRAIMKCTHKLDEDYNKVAVIEDDGTVIFDEDKLKKWANPTILKKCETCNVRPACLSRFCPNKNRNLENDLTCQKSKQAEIHFRHFLKYGG